VGISKYATLNQPSGHYRGAFVFRKGRDYMDKAVLYLQFANHLLVFSEYSTLDISRRGNEFNINVTNQNADLAFNAIYNKFLEYLEKDKTFTVTVKKENGEATFHNIAADYHLTGQGELLHFKKITEQTEAQKNGVNDESLE